MTRRTRGQAARRLRRRWNNAGLRVCLLHMPAAAMRSENLPRQEKGERRAIAWRMSFGGAVLMEANDEWQLQHRYLSIEAFAAIAAGEDADKFALAPPAAAPILTPGAA